MALLDLIAPPALKFDSRTIALGDQVGRVLVMTDYPPRVGPAWLARLARLPGVSLSVHISPSDPLKLLENLNKSIGDFTTRLATGGNALLQQRTRQSIDDAQELLRKIDQESQRVFRFTVVLLVLAAAEEELARRVRVVQAACAGAGMRARPAAYLQEQGLAAAGPWALLPKDVEHLGARDVPAETVAATFPWMSGGLNHGHGIVWGRDSERGLVLIDRWDRPPDSGMANPNANLLGTSGGGKSTAATMLLLREYALGARMIVLDPEREYRALCRRLGGSWINAAGGRGRFNPYQIGPVPDTYDEETDQDASPEEAERIQSPLARHMQRVKTFHALYLPALSDLEQALLEDATLAAYARRGIDWETEPAAVAVWPTVQDVRDEVAERPGAERLAQLLKSAVAGADSHLWNGQTSIPAAGDFVVFDLHDLQEASDPVRRAQYFNILGHAWDTVREGRAQGRRTVLVVDEAWILADPQTPQALAFLRDLSKRVRKYNGSLNVITQNVGDFLAPDLVRFGGPVIANASVKLLMRQEAKDAEALRDLLKLSEPEAELLATARVGEGLLIAGNSRVRLTVEPSPAEWELIG